jgi:hypothetical protein
MLHSSEYTEASPPLFLHECRSHVYRAIVAWILSKKRPKEVKDIGNGIIKMFKHLAVEATSCSQISVSPKHL